MKEYEVCTVHLKALYEGQWVQSFYTALMFYQQRNRGCLKLKEGICDECAAKRNAEDVTVLS